MLMSKERERKKEWFSFESKSVFASPEQLSKLSVYTIIPSQ